MQGGKQDQARQQAPRKGTSEIYNQIYFYINKINTWSATCKKCTINEMTVLVLQRTQNYTYAMNFRVISF